MTGRQIFDDFGRYINGLVFVIALLPRRWREELLVFFRGTKGIKGELFRYLLFAKLTRTAGQNISIKEDVYIHDTKNIKCGSNISIHEMCYINACGRLIIGDNVSIAHGTSILTFNHTWDDLSQPIKYNHTQIAPVIIEDDVWIGCGCRILAGVRVGTRSVVAAGSVVTKDVPPHSLVAGVPAKVIKNI